MNKEEDPSGFKIKTYQPSWEEFKDLNRFIRQIEKDGAHKAGIVKIIPPKEWVPSKSGYNIEVINAMMITPQPQRIREYKGWRGFFHFVSQNKKPPMSVGKFRETCSKNNPTPLDVNLPNYFWSNIVTGNKSAVLYGEGVDGSLMDKDLANWNFRKLGSILDLVEEEQGKVYEGVNTPWLYFGSWKTSFGWHNEDMDLYSINYLHFGQPKHWYAIPPSYSKAFESLCGKLFPEELEDCRAFMRHKLLLARVDVLQEHGIPVDSVIQEVGDIIITFPCGYHSGFNYGFNCAEAVNFALERWVEYGKRASVCVCKGFSYHVRIDMEMFVRKFQPNNIKAWLEDRDYGPHPENLGGLRLACGKHVTMNDYSSVVEKIVYEERMELPFIPEGLEPVSDDEFECSSEEQEIPSISVDVIDLPDGRRTIKITNIPYEATNQDLENHFSSCGSILRSTILLDNQRKSRGFGFIEFADPMGVEYGLKLDGKPLWQGGRRLNVTRKVGSHY